MPIIRSKVTSKGQITVPLEVRKRLGVAQGDQVEFDTDKPEIVIRPVRAIDNPFRKWRGAVGGFPGGRKEIDGKVVQVPPDVPSRKQGRAIAIGRLQKLFPEECAKADFGVFEKLRVGTK